MTLELINKNISSECKNRMKITIEEFVENLERRFELNEIELNEYDDVLFLCVQLLDRESVSSCNEMLERLIFKILNDLKTRLYAQKQGLISKYGMMKGLGLLGYSFYILQKKRNKSKGISDFSKFINYFLCEYYKKYIPILNQYPTVLSHYDLVSGVSGVLQYFLECPYVSQEKLIFESIDYLISLASFKQYKGERVISFHIQRDEQFLEKEKEEMGNGHINFGLAHGMVSVFQVLAQYRSKGYIYKKEEVYDAALTIERMYKKFSIMENGILKFPTQLPYEDYKMGRNKKWSFNSGWCYGNAGIIQSLMRGEEYLGNQVERDYYKQAFYNILQQPIEKYHLELPILCHGYGSIVAMQIGMFRDIGEKECLMTIERNIERMIVAHNQFKSKSKFYLDDCSVLQGAGGVVMTLVDLLENCNLEYKNILMVNRWEG